MEAIGVDRPDHDPHATAYVEQMVDLIGELVERGDAYVTDDGVYFSPAVVDDYGLLARQSLESLQAGARVEVAEHKRSPVDFALWKFAKPGEPSWPSPWGEGRPGWHTECVVMSLDLLGDGFDIHGGGLDLAFPHHENERAQAVAAGPHLRPPLGAQRLRRGRRREDVEEPRQLHQPARPGRVHRPPGLPAARAAGALPLAARDLEGHAPTTPRPPLGGLDALARRVGRAEPAAGAAPTPRPWTGSGRLMDDDLDTAAVGGAALRPRRPGQHARSMPTMTSPTAAPLAAAVPRDLPARRASCSTPAATTCPTTCSTLARRRDEARVAKDWALADALRDQLVATGWVVEDTPSGTQVRPA